MSIGLVGRKAGMTRLFKDNGDSIPVTVIEVLPNCITQVKTLETDGYEAIQVTVGERRQSLVNKPSAGHYKKAGVAPGEGLWEFRVSEEEVKTYLQAAADSKADEGKAEEGEAEPEAKEAQPAKDSIVGASLTVTLFNDGQIVDVTGTSKGKGFAGVVKRHNFAMQDATHGNSISHRAPGSIGQCQTPGRVFKGKKMAGNMGNVQKTVQNLEVVSIDTERNLILVKGAVPGHTNGRVFIKPAVKQSK